MTKSRNINRPRWAPTPDQVEAVRTRFQTTKTGVLADEFGVTYQAVWRLAKQMGLTKDRAWLNGPEGGRTDGSKGMGTRFQKGHTTWNKGVPGSTGTHPNCLRNHFKAGNRPHTWLPIGSHRLTKDGYLQRKCTDTGYPPKDWVHVHRLVWEAAHGPVPDGYAVCFLSGQFTADAAKLTADRLECIPRAELMRRNSLHRMPKQLAELVHLRGVLTRQINQRAKKGEA